jgi:hypothetical protein
VGLNQHPSPHGRTVLYDSGRRERIFCPDRYALSRDLPGIIAEFATGKAKLYRGWHKRNWAYIWRVATPHNTYYMFFKLEKSTEAGCDLSMHVESAYVDDPALDAPNVGRAMAFAIVCRKIHQREKIEI